MTEVSVETIRKVWIGKGYLLVRPWPEDPGCIEICTEFGSNSEGYFGSVSITFGTPEGTRAALAQPAPEGLTPDHVNLICFALEREPWATWLRRGGCLESAHCELSDLMLAVLARWGRPAIEPVPTPEPGTGDHITDDEGTRWDHTMDAALWAKAFCLICPEMASQEDLMIGWFANAIMAGCDHQAWKMDAERKPVPVAERLPGAEDCNAEGRCWIHQPRPEAPEAPEWKLANAKYASVNYGTTHWLPHWALPVPTSQEATDA